MNDYSRSFSNPDSFITSVVFNLKENTFSVAFANQQMFIWPITKENVERIANMLTAQYNEVIKNQSAILKNNKWTQGAIIVLVSMIALCIGSNVAELTPALTSILTTFSLSGAVASTLTIGINELITKRSFKEKFKIAKDFLANRRELIEAMCEEHNMISDINAKTEAQIRRYTYLAGSKVVDLPTNIFMLDEAMNNNNLQDISTMLSKLRTYRGILTETAEFKKQVPKTRTRKKEHTAKN